MTKGFEKLPTVKGSLACVTCGAGARSDLSMSRHICVGFGQAGYSKNGQILWEETNENFEMCPTVQTVEDMAMKDPDNDWRIFFIAPLYEAEYQRQGLGIWALVKKGDGFA